MTKKLSIDRDDLLAALDSGDPELSWFLDTETGEVLLLTGFFDGWEDDKEDETDEETELRRAVRDGDPRYRYIEPISSHESFRFMEDFIDQLPEGEAADELWKALDRHRPFRSFKDALYQFPDVREQWYRYQERRQEEYAREWLESEGIEPVWRVVAPVED